MNDYKTIDDIKNNIDDVLLIIKQINDNIQFSSLANFCLSYNMPENEYLRKDALKEYFLDGNCNIYVQILAKVFDGDIKYFVSNDLWHVAAGIGDFLYDVTGLIPPHLYKKYTEYDLDSFKDVAYWMGPHNEDNLRLIEEGAQLGKKKINELLGLEHLRK